MRRLATFGLLLAVGCGGEGVVRDSALPWLATGPDSQYQIVRDVAGILNELDVPWTLWTYREWDFGESPDGFDHFALLRGPCDATLAGVYRHEPLWQAFTEALAE